MDIPKKIKEFNPLKNNLFEDLNEIHKKIKASKLKTADLFLTKTNI